MIGVTENVRPIDLIAYATDFELSKLSPEITLIRDHGGRHRIVIPEQGRLFDDRGKPAC